MEQIDQRQRRIAAALGAVSGAVGVVAVLPFFFPLGRLFDPSVGGDTPVGLGTEVALGAMAGLTLSPIGATIGGAIGWYLRGRRVSFALAVFFVALAAVISVAFMMSLDGVPFDENGLTESAKHAGSLGAVAGIVSVAVYDIARRQLVSRAALVG